MRQIVKTWTGRMICFAVLVVFLWVACLPTEPKATQVVQQPEVTATNEPEVRPRPSPTPTAIAPLKATTTTLSTSVPTMVLTPIPSLTPSPWQKIAAWPVNNASFAPYFELSQDGSLLATTDLDTGILYVFDTTTWELLWEIDEPNRGLTNYVLDFSPDGTFLAGSGQEQDIYVWDMQTGEKIYTFDNPYYLVNSVTFSSDNKLLAVSTPEALTNSRITIWNMESGQPLPNQLKATEYGWYVNKIGFIPNQPHLLAVTAANINMPEDWQEGFKSGGLYFWDIDSATVQEAITGTLGLGIVISSNGQYVITAIDDDVRIWNVDKRNEPFPWMAEASPVALTNARIAAVENGKLLSVWNLSGQLLGMLTTKYPISDVAFFPNGDLVVAYFAENESQVFEVWRLSN